MRGLSVPRVREKAHLPERTLTTEPTSRIRLTALIFVSRDKVFSCCVRGFTDARISLCLVLSIVFLQALNITEIIVCNHDIALDWCLCMRVSPRGARGTNLNEQTKL